MPTITNILELYDEATDKIIPIEVEYSYFVEPSEYEGAHKFYDGSVVLEAVTILNMDALRRHFYSNIEKTINIPIIHYPGKV